MNEYFCPHCSAILNDQYGFDPDKGTWTCTECGMHLMDDDVYDGDTFEGVAWYCDGCGVLLNRQPGFSDIYGSWECTKCGHINGTTEDDIINKNLLCPNCKSLLSGQFSFSGWMHDYECSECKAKLHRDYDGDPFEIVPEDNGLRCPCCETLLTQQYSFNEWLYDYVCNECGTKLYREYRGDPFEIVPEDEGPKCPCCDALLNHQYSFDECLCEHVCSECGAKLHRNYDGEPFEEVEENDEESFVDEEEKYSPPPPRTYERTHETSEESSSQPRILFTPEGELRKKRAKAFLFKRKKIQIGYDPDDLLRKDYQAVNLYLHNNAFTNIKSIPVKDIYVDSPYTVGEVEQIVINGSQHFSCDDMIPYDSEIIIIYHEKREISIPFNARFCRKKNYADICSQLRALGFINIVACAIRDLTTGWLVKDGSIEKVIIGEDSTFKKGTICPYDVKILVKYHTFKKKK